MLLVERRGPVLVVDDDTDLRDAVQDILLQEGYLTAAARDGTEALSWLVRNPAPPMILLDWNMAPMNGSQFMAAFTSSVHAPSTAVVLFTADSRAQSDARTGGFAGILCKPVELDDLFSVVRRYCC